MPSPSKNGLFKSTKTHWLLSFKRKQGSKKKKKTLEEHTMPSSSSLSLFLTNIEMFKFSPSRAGIHTDTGSKKQSLLIHFSETAVLAQTLANKTKKQV